MRTGPGSADAQGVYHFGEADNPDGSFSGLMDLALDSISTQFENDRDRLDELETVRYFEATTSVTLADHTDGTMGTVTRDPTQSINDAFVSIPSTGTLRLAAGVYTITLNVNVPAATTGLSLLGIKWSAGTKVLRTPFSTAGSDVTISFTKRFTAQTDVTLYLYQTTGGARTMAGVVTVTKLG